MRTFITAAVGAITLIGLDYLGIDHSKVTFVLVLALLVKDY